MKRVILVKYGEIALRKGNRAKYERRLMDALRARVNNEGDDSPIHVTREQGRLLIEDTRGDIDAQAVLSKIGRTFGVTAFCIGIKTDDRHIDNIKARALALLRETNPAPGTSFKVETKRGDKSYPLLSQAVSAETGAYILGHMPDLTVDLHNPYIVLNIEIRTCAYIYIQSVKGEGGLPYGSSGKGVLLLSGGIDSPVAGYLTARRGVEIVPVYFHSPPFISERVTDKVLDISKKLAAYTGKLRVYIVPFTEIQLYLKERVRQEKLTLFLKRAMLGISSALAAAEGAHCLITGDSVGQVASQTIHGIEAVNSAAALPVLRPLAAFDKQWIIDISKKIGAYDISIRPYDDCCTLFAAEHPESRPLAAAIERIASRLTELPGLMDKALSGAVIYESDQDRGGPKPWGAQNRGAPPHTPQAFCNILLNISRPCSRKTC